MSKKDKGQAAVYNIVAFNFEGKDTAKETIKEAKKAGRIGWLRHCRRSHC